jgi:hypothetical protein
MSLFTDLQAAGLPVISASDGQSATFSRSLSEAETEIYLDLLDPTRPTKRTEFQTAVLQFKDEYQAAKTRLSQIENAANPTNAQVIQAIRDIAKYERLLAKLLARFIIG